MILYSAVGGGLGHLTRAAAFLNTRERGEEAVVICSSPHARYVSGLERAHLLDVPESVRANALAYGMWMRNVVGTIRPKRLYLDTFPAGLFGEFRAFPFPADTRLFLVARILRVERYLETYGADLPHFERVFLCERMPESGRAFAASLGETCEDLELVDPPASGDPSAVPDRDFWFIEHSGPEEEVRELLEYARSCSDAEGTRPMFVLNTPSGRIEGADIRTVSTFRSLPFYERAKRIITGAGFNVMRKARAFKEKHRALPFQRRFDDQALRVRLSRR